MFKKILLISIPFLLLTGCGGVNIGSRVYNLPPLPLNGQASGEAEGSLTLTITDQSYTGSNSFTPTTPITLTATIPASALMGTTSPNVTHSPVFLVPDKNQAVSIDSPNIPVKITNPIKMKNP